MNLKQSSSRLLVHGLLLAALAACGFQRSDINADCEDCGFYVDAKGRVLTWPDGTQIQWSFNSSVPESARPAIEGAALRYNGLLKSTQFSVKPQATAPDYINNPKEVEMDGVNGIYWVEGRWPWPEQDQADAITVVSFAGGRIVEADMFFRGESFSVFKSQATNPEDQNIPSELKSGKSAVAQGYWAAGRASGGAYGTMNATSMAQQSLHLLALHELGHSLGRTHTQKHEDSIMYPSVSVRYFNEPFAEFDLEILKRGYELLIH